MAKNRPKPLSQINFAPWQTASRTNTERIGYIKVGTSLLLSSPFQALKHSSRALYLQLISIAEGKKEFVLSNNRGAELCGMSASTFKRAISELVEKGFIEKCPVDDMAQFETSRYIFSVSWKDSLTDEERRRFTG